MEGGVEDHDLGHIFAQSGDTSPDAQYVRGVVQRGQIGQARDILDDLVVDQGGFGEDGTALHDAVAHSRNLLHGIDHLQLALGQSLHQALESLGVGGHGDIGLKLAAVGHLVADLSGGADALADALGQNALIGHVDELIL